MRTYAAAVVVVAVAASVKGDAVELTQDNYDAMVKNSGKNAFVKFLAPWCAGMPFREAAAPPPHAHTPPADFVGASSPTPPPSPRAQVRPLQADEGRLGQARGRVCVLQFGHHRRCGLHDGRRQACVRRQRSARMCAHSALGARRRVGFKVQPVSSSLCCGRADPTIKYFTAETGEGGSAYQGGRSFDDLNKFVVDNLAAKCLVEEPSACSEKEVGGVARARGKHMARTRSRPTCCAPPRLATSTR